MANGDDLPRPSEWEFCPDDKDMFSIFLDLLPRGDAWVGDDYSLTPNTTLKKFWYAIAKTYAKFEADMCDSLDQWFCYAADTDLDAWERDYGIPDDCDIYNASVCSKVEAVHEPTALFLTGLLNANGYSAVGRWLRGNDAEFPGVRSTFVANVDPYLSPAYTSRVQLKFKLGEHRRLGYPTDISKVDCMLERYIPAHTIATTTLAGQWSPTALGAKLIGWFDADDTSDGAVTTWTARTGGFVASVPGGMVAPISAVHSSGYRYVEFNGSTQALRIATITGIPVGTVPGKLIGLARVDAGSRYLLSIGNTVNAREIVATNVADVDPPNTVRLRMRLGSMSVQLTDMSGIVMLGPSIYLARYRADFLTGRLNGNVTSPANTPMSTFNTPGGYMTIGGNYVATPTAATLMLGGHRHIFILSDALTSSEEYKLEGWLAWDILRSDLLPGEHPYKNIRP